LPGKEKPLKNIRIAPGKLYAGQENKDLNSLLMMVVMSLY